MSKKIMPGEWVDVKGFPGRHYKVEHSTLVGGIPILGLRCGTETRTCPPEDVVPSNVVHVRVAVTYDAVVFPDDYDGHVEDAVTDLAIPETPFMEYMDVDEID